MYPTHFINLKSLSNYPAKKVIWAQNGINYKRKEEHLRILQERINGKAHFQLKICSIDDFNKSKKLMPNHKQVLIKKKSEDHIPSIGKYTEPLLMLNSWEIKTVGLVNELWEVLHEDNLFDHPLFDDNSEWKYTNNVDYFMKQYNNTKIEKIIKILKKWKYDVGSYNFNRLLDTTKLFSKYNVTDFSSTGKLLTEERNCYVDVYNSQIDSIKSDIIKINHFKKIQVQFDNDVPLNRMFPPFDFQKVYPYDLLSMRLLTNMHKVAGMIGGGREWIKENGDIYSSGKISKQLLYHPTINEDGHSGSTMFWTVNTLQEIYKEGWENYIGQIYQFDRE